MMLAPRSYGSGTEMARDYDTFIAFLRVNGCLDEFRDNFYGFNNCNFFCRDMWEIMGGDEYFVNRAFDWSGTSQGRDFWKDIDRKWAIQCRNADAACLCKILPN